MNQCCNLIGQNGIALIDKKFNCVARKISCLWNCQGEFKKLSNLFTVVFRHIYLVNYSVRAPLKQSGSRAYCPLSGKMNVSTDLLEFGTILASRRHTEKVEESLLSSISKSCLRKWSWRRRNLKINYPLAYKKTWTRWRCLQENLKLTIKKRWIKSTA